MGQFKDVGNPLDALAEECAEVIQIIAKFRRFGGDLNDIPEGKDKSRKQQLIEEMCDLSYQWRRVTDRWKQEDLAVSIDVDMTD